MGRGGVGWGGVGWGGRGPLPSMASSALPSRPLGGSCRQLLSPECWKEYDSDRASGDVTCPQVGGGDPTTLQLVFYEFVDWCIPHCLQMGARTCGQMTRRDLFF